MAEIQERLVHFVDFYSQIIKNKNSNNVLKGLDGNSMENIIMGLIPFHRISSTKVLLGSQVKTISIRSDRLLVTMGGGAVPLEEYWRA